MIRKFEDKVPNIHESAFVAETAAAIGDVTLMEDATVWYGAVLRGDSDKIVIGKGSNVQDCAVIHVDGGFPALLGENVTVGHSAVVHGAQVGDNVLIGMHATVLNGAVIGEGSIIGAGALVREGQVIPPRSVVIGMPGKILKEATDAQVEGNIENARHYVELGKKYKG